ncbi:hypothetical protein DPMN_011708 [Dreissena polymorpha]|uniref:MAM domain-containing protein n=1 Tax=Dreissena polymorpha TaxID=45954 RepID=A0A9D4N251_DREPO|nr:hypothetical protein DPMN_011708 [Dreissena polymorpha]
MQVGSNLGSAVWTRVGTQGNQWNLGQTDLPASASTYNIVFEGVGGPGYRGDIALDDIRVLPGSCSYSGLHHFLLTVCGLYCYRDE